MSGAHVMESNTHITAVVFAAYQNCPTKAYLLFHGVKPSDSFSASKSRSLSTAYKAAVKDVVSINFSKLACDANPRESATFVDSETASYPLNQSMLALSGSRIDSAALGQHYVPILYSPWNKLEKSSYLLVSFAALAIAHAVRTSTPPKGRIVYGDSKRTKNVKITDYLKVTQNTIAAIASECSESVPPPVVLNKHCSSCDFQSRCRGIAIRQEDLSLLGAMTKKERTKCVEKGIVTITQLSYGYRPRRRRRMRSTSSAATPPLRHNHKLKALAIKKSQTHVVGSPALCMNGTPVFMDVEGMPDRNSYYLY